VYAYLLADRIHGHHRMKREDVSRVMSREWPLFQLSFPLAVPLRGLTWQKLFLGDWSRVIRDPIDVYRLAFIAATIAWGITGRPVTALIGACALLVLGRLAETPPGYRPRGQTTGELPDHARSVTRVGPGCDLLRAKLWQPTSAEGP
jgi:hypothetical protein